MSVTETPRETWHPVVFKTPRQGACPYSRVVRPTDVACGRSRRPAAPGDTVRGTVIAEMPLYAQPDAGSEVVGSLPVGSTIQGKEEADGWYVASMGEQNVLIFRESFLPAILR